MKNALDGFKANTAAIIAGGKAAAKGRKTAEAIMARTSELFKQKGMTDFDRTNITILGAEDTFGANANPALNSREAVIWMSVQHRDKKAIDLWSREIASSGTGMAPGLCAMVGGRPKATPCLKLFSFLYPKGELPATVELQGRSEQYHAVISIEQDSAPTS